MRIYLDACCLNRPFNDQTQERIRLEAEAVLLIMMRVEIGAWQTVGSEVLDFEISRTPDAERRARVRLLADNARGFAQVGQAESDRSRELAALGFRSYDALHLACAESAGVDVFLTTDDRLLRRAKRLSPQLRVRVENPVAWLTEAMNEWMSRR